MTLVKWNRGNRTNGSGSLRDHWYPATVFGDMLPGIFNAFTTPLLSRDLIQDFFDDTQLSARGGIGTTLPPVNITETDNDLVIEMAAPGMDKKLFSVEVHENQLHIGYRKPDGDGDSGNTGWRREFSFSSFDRTFTLPAIVEGDQVSASYRDGILRVTIPKKEEARRKPSRLIEIK